MKYATLIYTRPGSHDAELTEDEQAALSAEYMAMRFEPQCVGGGHLQPVETATTLRGDGLITDGPYADTKEVFAGYFVIEADNLDQALEWAKRIPAVRLGGAVEVRPLVELPGELAH
ncbi:dehydrogenase [Mycolicibacterium sp. TY66]|uniref:YciI family protein n=1 Tax=Mycobacteriaceae TaxID=1762 RepID=UPI001BB3386B|nr:MULTISPECIES: YciI family protein [unclassified Mycolicibacterium]BCI83146.1 dehydrogenase [Mycolicibacterium sp. TY66]BCJ79207.1 dehydrogenase [Mycolicibacterium sp. TY81]